MKNLIFLFLLLTTAASAQDTIRYCTGQFSEAYIEALQEQGNVMLDTCQPKIIGTLLKARDLQSSYEIYFAHLKKQHPDSDENTHGLFNYSEDYLMLDMASDTLRAQLFVPADSAAMFFIEYLEQLWPERFAAYKMTIDSLQREVDFWKGIENEPIGTVLIAPDGTFYKKNVQMDNLPFENIAIRSDEDKVETLLYFVEKKRDEAFRKADYLQQQIWTKIKVEVKSNTDDLLHIKGVIPTSLELVASPKGDKTDLNLAAEAVLKDYQQLIDVIFK